jgi:hypothetical protein
MCPFCLTSCDELVSDESAGAEPGDMDPCCEGECDVSEVAVAKWQEQIAPLLEGIPQGVRVTVAEGPCEWG